MFGMISTASDRKIKQYVDRIFETYDTDRSGTLEAKELQVFFNDLFTYMGSPQRVTRQQAQRAINSVDLNGDGSVDKTELLLAFKNLQQMHETKMIQMRMTQQQQMLQQQMLQQNMYQQHQHHMPSMQQIPSYHHQEVKRPPVQPVANNTHRRINTTQNIYDTPEPYYGSTHQKAPQYAHNGTKYQ